MKRTWTVAGMLGVASVAFGQDQSLIQYDHLETGFVFSYPADWKLTKQRDHITLTIPFADVSRSATLEVYGVQYSNDIPTWQAIQTNAAKQLKREIIRQWQEEILTVPMLMARTQWDSKGTSRTADMALIYANTQRKLAFRLTSDTEDFTRADGQFRNLIQSLKMADGGLPKVWDPSKPTSENLRSPDRGGNIGVWKTERLAPPVPVKGDSTVEASASAIALVIRFRSPWKGTSGADGLKFTHPEVAGEMSARAFTTLEADPAGRALIKASAVSLSAFSKIAKREEKGPLPNKPASTYATIWREGQGSSGALCSLDAVVSSGDYYVLFHWESNDLKSAAKMRKHVDELINSLSVEVKPSS